MNTMFWQTAVFQGATSLFTVKLAEGKAQPSIDPVHGLVF